MKVGDMVTPWDDGRGPIGLVIRLTQNGQVVLVLMDEETKRFAGDELWIFYESR